MNLIGEKTGSRSKVTAEQENGTKQRSKVRPASVLMWDLRGNKINCRCCSVSLPLSIISQLLQSAVFHFMFLWSFCFYSQYLFYSLQTRHAQGVYSGRILSGKSINTCSYVIFGQSRYEIFICDAIWCSHMEVNLWNLKENFEKLVGRCSTFKRMQYSAGNHDVVPNKVQQNPLLVWRKV